MSNMSGFSRRAVQERSDPAIGAVAINYAGGNQVLNVASRGLYIAGAGNLAVIMVGGDTVTFTGLLAGVVYPIAVHTIIQAGSTASGLVLT